MYKMSASYRRFLRSMVTNLFHRMQSRIILLRTTWTNVTESQIIVPNDFQQQQQLKWLVRVKLRYNHNFDVP